MNKIKKLSILILLIFSILGCSKFSKIQKSEDVSYKYSKALEYYEKADYFHASTLLEEIIPLLKGQAEAEKANYLFAECKYKTFMLVESAYYYKKFYETYPRSDKAEEARYKHCLSLYEDTPDQNLDQTNSYQALESIQEFLIKYPDSKYTKECQKLNDELTTKLEYKYFELAKVYFKISEFKAAIIAFDNLIKDYPASKTIEEFHYYKVKSSYELAKKSIDAKKPERYKNTISFYEKLVDQFPNGKFTKLAQTMYESSNKELKKSI